MPHSTSFDRNCDGHVAEVTVRSAARLHFGFLDVTGSLGRKFGSLGLSLSGPKICVRARRSDALEIFGADDEARRAALLYAERFYAYPEIGEALRSARHRAWLYLDRTIPSHMGLGSGTQLALSVVAALCRLYGIDRSVGGAALIARRGLRSGIGIESFKSGGFIVDGGGGNGEDETPLTLFRRNFPRDWRVVLVFPPGARGLSGKDEERAFGGMEPDSGASAEICRLVLMKLLPGLLEEKLEVFGDAIERIQRITGESFAGAGAQSGCYASPLAEDIFSKMRRLGAHGMGQSSWGPLLYGFARDRAAARGVALGLRGFSPDVAVNVVSGRNVGARVKFL